VTERLRDLALLVQRESGIVIREAQYGALAAAFERADEVGDLDDFMRRAADPATGGADVARLLDEVTVKETFFLRESVQLEGLDWLGLYERARSAGAEAVRVWSAGCATGEEAYTLALLACRAFGAGDPPVRILATDISEAALTRAREGAYRPRSTRELGPDLRARYFREDGERLVAGDRLKSLVTFRRHNLVCDAAPPFGEAPFDLILCRNVLIYFDAETVDRVVEALSGALAPDGELLLGAADALSRGAGRLRTLATAAAPVTSEPRGRPWPLRAPLGRADVVAQDATALDDAAGASASDEVISLTRRLLAADPLNASAHVLHGLAELEAGDAEAAVAAFRRALYAEPRSSLAAFQLGRAYEALGNHEAARRSYARALRTYDQDGDLNEPLLGQVDLGEILAAAEARLDALASVGIRGGTR
jgi:chemotaxis protein methyltransferase CheR